MTTASRDRCSSSLQVPVSVVVVAFHSDATLDAAIDSVLQVLPDSEIVVVDNGGTTGLAIRDLVHRGHTVVSGHGNIGFGAGVNLGVKHCSRDIIVVLNPDAELLSFEMGEPAPDGSVGLVAGSTGRSRPHRRRSWRFDLAWTLYQFFAPRPLQFRKPDHCARRGETWVSGACFAVKKSEFEALGGFDESLFLYFEDQDLSRRYHERQLPVRIDSGIHYAHLGQGSSDPSGTGEPFAAACALLGLGELATKEDRESPASIVSTISAALVGIAALAQVLGLVPGVRTRARKKSAYARSLRTEIQRLLSQPPSDAAFARLRSS